MDDKQRGDDAQDHTAMAKSGAEAKPPADKQDASNYEERTDEQGAIEVEDLSSANDEGGAKS